jgi:DNA-directed RNA polymerase specialized sigma24 family protein
MSDLVEDWSKLINEELSLNSFVSTHWEKFLGVYINVMRKRDDSELYIKLYEYVEKMLKLDVIPVFEYPAQITQYFKHCLVNDKINSVKVKKLNVVSLDSLNERINFEPKSDANFDSNENELNLLLCEIEKRVSPIQMTSIMLLLKGYSRKEICELLGVNIHTINDRIYRTKEIIQEILNG